MRSSIFNRRSNSNERKSIVDHAILKCALSPLLMTLSLAVMSSVESADDIEAVDCYLILKDEAQIPARERGLLKAIQVEPGDVVQVSQVVASLEDNEARLALRLAEIDLNVARQRSEDAVAVEITEAAVKESSKLTQQAKLDQQISAQMAESDIVVRLAVSASELAKDAFDRAVESREKFQTSVSSREMATVKFELGKTRIDIEQAKYEQSLQLLRANSQTVLVEQREIAGRRLQLEMKEAQLEHGIAALTAQRMATSVDVAREKLDRHQMKSPLTGVVVKKLHHVGEWVEAGEPVLRVIRLDTLFVEGYVAATLVDHTFRGHEVSVTSETREGTVTVVGHVVFVSPEIDPVNGQVRVRAEIHNAQLKLRPGQQVQMVIRAE
jgi:multidrug efflux pump subunit AcrA (membrane-fusion protein)